MKRFFLTALVAAAFAFGMSACCNNNNAPAEEVADSTAEMCEHHCHHSHECTCDSTCAANHCEACPDTNCACKHHCCHHHACADTACAKHAEGGEGCCKAKAAGQECCKEGNKECHKECCKHKEQK